MNEHPRSEVARYWDENRAKSKDPTFWMAHPLCRQAINRRVSGSPHEWPLDWFKRVHAVVPFRRGVSWGSGLGSFERSARRTQVVAEIDAFDISPASLDDARREAEAEGISGIHYRHGDFDDPRLGWRRYDICFFHASLHHVSRLERLFRRLIPALVPGAAVYVDEFVGPSRSQWTNDQLQLVQGVLDMIPEEAKIKRTIDLPIEPNDPSEGVRAGEITAFLETFLDIIEWRPYGGQILGLVLPCLAAGWTSSPEGEKHVAAMIEMEDYLIRTFPSSTHHAVAYGRLKPLPQLALPLGRQALRSLRHRLRQT